VNANKIVLIEVIAYVILYLVVYNIAKHSNLTPSSDAAGKGMERGYLLLLTMAIFLVIAIGVTIINFFLLKKVTNPGIKLTAFIPLISSVAHIAYTILFG
jgi:hypothetical protein